MKIILSNSFAIALESQIDYISKDSIFYAKRFKKDVIQKIKEIPKNPFILKTKTLEI